MRHFILKTDAPLNFSVCGQLISPHGFLHHRRIYEYHVLIVVLEGTLHITSNGCEYTLGENDYIFLKAGEEHFGTKPSEGRLSYLWVHFQTAGDLQVCENETACSGDDSRNTTVFHTCTLPETGTISKAGRVSQLFHQLMDFSMDEPHSSLKNPMTDHALSLLIMEISREYVQNCNSDTKTHPLALTAIEWIKKHYHQPFSVPDMADELGYHADYLSTVFKRSTGKSVIRFTNELRIRNAKTLFSNYDLTVKEAAYSCGFSDEKYFMKVFKELEGCTPSQYKNAFGRKSFN